MSMGNELSFFLSGKIFKDKNRAYIDAHFAAQTAEPEERSGTQIAAAAAVKASEILLLLAVWRFLREQKYNV